MMRRNRLNLSRKQQPTERSVPAVAGLRRVPIDRTSPTRGTARHRVSQGLSDHDLREALQDRRARGDVGPPRRVPPLQQLSLPVVAPPIGCPPNTDMTLRTTRNGVWG